MKKLVFLSLVLFLIPILGFAQQFSYKHFTIFDGISQNQTKEIYQDSKDFIWISNKKAINRFDGKNFVEYDISHCQKRIVTKFFEYNKQLFCLTESDLLYLKNNKFISIFKSTSSIVDIDFNEDSSKVFLLTHNEIFEISKDLNIRCYNLSKYSYLVNFTYIPDNGFLVASNYKLMHLTKDNKLKIVLNKTVNSIIRTKDNRIFCILPDNNFDTKINQQGKICEYINGEFKIIYKNQDRKLEDKLVLLKSNNLIFFEDRSIWVKIDLNGNLIETDSLQGQQIVSTLEDRNKMLWFTTENGLFYLMSFAFRNYDERIGMPKYIWSIFEDKDSNIVFASFYSDLVKIKNNEIINLNYYKQQIGKELSFYMDGLSNSHGQWMIPTVNNILIKDKGKFSLLKLENNNLESTALSTYEDIETQKVYFGTNHGIYTYDLITKNFDFNKTESNVLNIEKDKYGRFWICTAKEVLLFNGENFVSFNDNELAIDKGVISAKRDIYGNMWIAKRTGLFIYTYNNEYKVSNKEFHFLELYKNRHIIAGSILGIYYIDLKKFYKMEKHSINYFDRFNGFIGKESGQNGTCIDSKGNVWIPTSESVVKFTPSKLLIDSSGPKTYIYNINFSGNDLKWEGINLDINLETLQYKTNYKKNNIQISFHAIDLKCPERLRYKYRLIGFDDEWIETNKETITYTNLKPRNYKFEFIGINENNYISENTTAIFITVKPAFWQTWLFRIFVILCLIGLIILFIDTYLKVKRKQEKRERKIKSDLLQMQLNAINAQLDPHFVFNTINAISYVVQEDNKKDAYNYFVKLSRLLRDSLSTRSKITRTLDEELEFVSNYLCLQKLRFGDRFKYNFEISKNTDYSFIVPKMCLQIFVENALKHGLEPLDKNGKLKITVYFDDKGFYSTIQDNGIGRTASKLKNHNTAGIGIKSFTDFFELINQFNDSKAGFTITDLQEKDNSSAGTKVELFIPYNYNYNII